MGAANASRVDIRQWCERLTGTSRHGRRWRRRKLAGHEGPQRRQRLAAPGSVDARLQRSPTWRAGDRRRDCGECAGIGTRASQSERDGSRQPKAAPVDREVSGDSHGGWILLPARAAAM